MNINKLIRRIKDHLGMTKYLSTSYNDKAIYDIIVNHALADWSYYFRYEFEPEYVKFDSSCITGSDIMVLPGYFTDIIKRSGFKIMDIKKIRFTNSLYGNMKHDMSIFTSFKGMMDKESLFSGQQMASNMGDMDMFMNYRYSCWYEAPNTLRFNYPILNQSTFGKSIQGVLDEAKMSVYINVSENLSSISPTREPYFFELCKLHVMRVIYENEVKYMESINSGQGNINLKVEEWSSAGERLKDLLRTLEGYSTLSQPGSGII